MHICMRATTMLGCKAVKRICHLVSLDKLLFLRSRNSASLLRMTSSRTRFASLGILLFLSPRSVAVSTSRAEERVQTSRPDSLCSRRIKREICEFARGIPVICEGGPGGNSASSLIPSRNTRFVERFASYRGQERGTRARGGGRREVGPAKRM